MKNEIIFAGNFSSCEKVVCRAISTFLVLNGSSVSLHPKVNRPPRIPLIYLVGCHVNFDGSSQEYGSKCGANTLIFLEYDRFINIWMNCR